MVGSRASISAAVSACRRFGASLPSQFDFAERPVSYVRSHRSAMSITVQLDLPDEVIEQARTLGLLDNKRMAEMLTEELRRRRAGQELKKMLEEIRSAPGEPMTMEEINAEIKAARAERREREAGR